MEVKPFVAKTRHLYKRIVLVIRWRDEISMSWSFESAWLKVLDMKGEIATALCLASIVVIVCADRDWLYISQLPKTALALVAILGIVSGLIAVARLGKIVSDKVQTWRRAKKEQAAIDASAKETLVFLNTLTDGERNVLSYLVQKNQQSFTGTMMGRNIVTLRQKRLIVMGTGIVAQDDVPYTIPPYVWAELQVRKEEFNTADLAGPYPWRDHWMTL